MKSALYKKKLKCPLCNEELYYDTDVRLWVCINEKCLMEGLMYSEWEWKKKEKQ